MSIVPSTPESIDQAAGRIRNGMVVAFPTETVYGLGADATNARAVAGVFAIKERPAFDPLIVHISALEMLEELAAVSPDPALELARRFWPGPLTLVLAKTKTVPDIVTAGLSSVALRIPDHAVALELILRSGRPIAAPSANRFGHVSPTTAQHVADQLGAQVPLILDGGPCRIGLESTIVSFVDRDPLLLRPGGVSLEDLEACIGPIRIATPGDGPMVPGRMPRHYAPRTPLTVIDAPSRIPPPQRSDAALLLVQPPTGEFTLAGNAPGPNAHAKQFAYIEILSESGRLDEAAANLFSAIRRLDSHGFAHIYAVAIAEHGLGRAIMDRLRRAQQP